MNRIFSFSLIAAAGLLLAGCFEMDETIANVYVVREEGGVEVPVSDAEVRLYALGSLDEDFVGEPRFDTTQVTTDEGFTSFNFSSCSRVPVQSMGALKSWPLKRTRPVPAYMGSSRECF